MSQGFKSAERVEDSSEDESDTSTPTQSLKQHVNSISPALQSIKPKNASDSDSSDPESDASPKSKGSAVSSNSPNGSSSVSSSTLKRKARQSPIDARPASVKKAKTINTDRSTTQDVKRIEAKMFVPPQAYTAVTTSASEFSAKTNGMFDSLDGKQIWYLSAPSTMPISKLESLDVSAALKGAPVLEHDRVTYTMSQASDYGPNLLLPRGTRGDYTPSDSRISRILQIREAARPVGNNSKARDETGENLAAPISFFATQTGTKKPPRKQPDNLRTRWTAFGTQDVDGIASDSLKPGVDATMEDAEVAPATPATRNVGSVQQAAKSDRKKKKKEKPASGEQDVEMLESTPRSSKKSELVDVLNEPSLVVAKKKKKRKDTAVQA